MRSKAIWSYIAWDTLAAVARTCLLCSVCGAWRDNVDDEDGDTILTSFLPCFVPLSSSVSAPPRLFVGMIKH